MMTTKTILFTAIAAMALTACGRNNFDINDYAVRTRPQTQSPIADAPNGKLPNGGPAIGGSVAIPVIINDGGSIFE
ncbi:MAG: hypothetical protein ACI9HB_002010 [Gammaproteobacteria bacterium]|jgi:hypothetical protein